MAKLNICNREHLFPLVMMSSFNMDIGVGWLVIVNIICIWSPWWTSSLKLQNIQMLQLLTFHFFFSNVTCLEVLLPPSAPPPKHIQHNVFQQVGQDGKSFWICPNIMKLLKCMWLWDYTRMSKMKGAKCFKSLHDVNLF